MTIKYVNIQLGQNIGKKLAYIVYAMFIEAVDHSLYDASGHLCDAHAVDG